MTTFGGAFAGVIGGLVLIGFSQVLQVLHDIRSHLCER